MEAHEQRSMWPRLGRYPIEPNIPPKQAGMTDIAALLPAEKRAVWAQIQERAPDLAEFLRTDALTFKATFGVRQIWFKWVDPRESFAAILDTSRRGRKPRRVVEICELGPNGGIRRVVTRTPPIIGDTDDCRKRVDQALDEGILMAAALTLSKKEA